MLLPTFTVHEVEPFVWSKRICPFSNLSRSMISCCFHFDSYSCLNIPPFTRLENLSDQNGYAHTQTSVDQWPVAAVTFAAIRAQSFKDVKRIGHHCLYTRPPKEHAHTRPSLDELVGYWCCSRLLPFARWNHLSGQNGYAHSQTTLDQWSVAAFTLTAIRA